MADCVREANQAEAGERGIGMAEKVAKENTQKELIKARFWNQGNASLAIIAYITKEVDWAAYIGCDDSLREEDTLRYAAKWGCKLSEKDARYFFPDIELPYRQ